jgi:hypothetical protein
VHQHISCPVQHEYVPIPFVPATAACPEVFEYSFAFRSQERSGFIDQLHDIRDGIPAGATYSWRRLSTKLPPDENAQGDDEESEASMDGMIAFHFVDGYAGLKVCRPMS